MALAPVILFAYNRPEHTAKTIQALAANLLAEQTVLYIYCDGEKANASEENKKNILEVRKIANQVQGFAQVHVIERLHNFGLAKTVIQGVTEVLELLGKVIVLEDDLVTSPFLLRYMNEALDLYESNDRVISIHGYVYPTKEALPETFFLRGADCWGWATWKRGWDLLNTNGHELLAMIESNGWARQFDYNGTYPYMRMLRNQLAGKVNSWAILWYASAFVQQKITLYPGHSLIRNIGADGAGTHVSATQDFEVELFQKHLALKDIPVAHNQQAYHIFEKYFRSIRPSVLETIAKRFKKWIP
jgi:hypothetical protein